MTEKIAYDGDSYQYVWPRRCCIKGHDILNIIFDYDGAISGEKTCSGEIAFFSIFQLH